MLGCTLGNAHNVTFSKVTKQWSAKPIKEKKDLGYLHRIVKETIKSAINCRKISLESQKLTKHLLLGTKYQDLEDRFSFFNCIYFLHLSKIRTKNDNQYNIQNL